MEIIEITNEVEIYKCAKIFMAANNAPPWNDHWDIEQSTRRLIDIYKSSNFLGFVCIENQKVIGFIIGNYYYFVKLLKYFGKILSSGNNVQRIVQMKNNAIVRRIQLCKAWLTILQTIYKTMGRC